MEKLFKKTESGNYKMIYLPNHLTQEELYDALNASEEERYSFAFRIIPFFKLTEQELTIRNNVETTFSFGETDKLLNNFRLLLMPEQKIKLQRQDMRAFMTQIKNVNPSINMGWSYEQIPEIDTDQSLLGTAIDKTLKYVVRKIKNRKVDISVVKRNFPHGDFKYPSQNTEHKEFTAFKILCEGRPLPKTTDLSSYFINPDSPLFFLGIAAKTLEGIVGISTTPQETMISFYHPTDYKNE